ncbi:MAG: hypothetical protein IBJ13_03955 [Sphingopyxis sp.]|nr:hypothetical protein [Sphingopyxis sp.]
MARFRTLVGLGLASTLMVTAPVFASTTQHPTPAAAAAKPTLRAPVKRAVAPTRAKGATPASNASARPSTHLAKATLSNGKKVTYDCRLAGNKNKQACKS